MLKYLVNAAALSALSCGLACGADEPVPPPPPAAQLEPGSELPAPTQDQAPTVPLPSRLDAAPAPAPAPAPVPYPCGTWQQDPGYYGYRPEAVVPGTNAGLHLRYPYYSYRRPWYPAGPAGVNVTIIW